MNTELTLPDNMQKETTDIVGQAETLIVKDNQSNKAATLLLRLIKDFQKEIKDELRPAIEDAHSLHKRLVAQEKKFLEPLQNAEQRIKLKINQFINEQEQIRIKAQQEALAKAKAEEDRQRKIKEEQERKWREKEAKAKAEADRLAAEGKSKEAEKARIEAEKAAEKAEERKEEAEAIHEPVAEIASDVEKQKGLSQRDNWTAQVLDPDAVIQAVIDGNLPRYCVKVDEAALKRHSKLEKKARTQYGVKFWNDSSVLVRT